MSAMEQRLRRALDGRMKRHVREGAPGVELGTITAAGLQIDNFGHLIRDWWENGDTPIAVGARVAVIPVAQGSDFIVFGPLARRGV